MPAFQSVQYIDPFAPLPVGASQAGVQAVLNPSGVTAGKVAYAQLVADLTPIAWGTGASANAVRVLNTVPLAAAVSYVLQVQFAAPGANPADLDWTNAAAIIVSPVIAQQLEVTSLAVTATGLTFAWDTPGGAAVAGAYLQIIDATTNALIAGFYLGVGPAGSVTATFTPSHAYQVAIVAVQPVAGGTAGAFAAPYTMGPPTIAQPIPTTAPALSRASYDGGELATQWTAPAAPVNAPAPSYELLLMDGANIVAVGQGGPGGAQLVTGQVTALGAPGAAARMRYGRFVGPPGTAVALQALPPKILAATVTGSPSAAAITAQLASPGALPAGGSLVATLYTNGVAGPTQTLTSASGSVSWTAFAAAANTAYEIDVVLKVTASGVTSQGPRSPRLTIPLIAPQQVTPVYDGQTVTINLAFAAGAGVDGYRVALSDGTNSQTVNAGPQLPISFPANLDVSIGKSWTATVTPVLGIVTALGAGGSVSLPTIAAPSLTSVVYDGESLFVQWSAATLPFLDGYRVAVSGGPSALTTADQTACVLPLTPAQAASAGVTVTGLSPLRSTAASAAVTILADPIQMTGVTVGSQVAATWTSGSAPAVRAELLIGDTLQSLIPGATATGVSFAAPTAANQPYRLRARAASADGIALGPPSATVDLLLLPPTLISGFLGDGAASLRWSPLDLSGAATFGIKAVPASGSPASFVVTGDGYDGPVPAAFTSAGTLTITPANALCTGPAASIPVQAAGAVTGAQYDGSQLTVTASIGTAGSTDTYWFDVLVDGAVAARKAVTVTGAQPSANVAVPVSLSEGSSASVRVTGIGPSRLALSSTPAGIPTAAPTLVSAAYDGSKLHVSWNPTPGPGVQGYIVSVANASVADTYVAGAESGSAAIAAALTYPFANNILVTVRAAFGSPNTSPYIQGAPSLPMSPILTGYAYSTGVGSPGNPPYVYRRGTYQTLSDVSGQPIVLYLPKPFTGSDNPTVPASGATAFKLAPATGNPPLPYQLTLGAGVWTSLGSTPVRSDLRQTYVQFLSAVEDVGVFPWAINLIRQLVAQAMPQTFEEVLYYRYGLWRSDSVRIVDLTPGTRLQLSTALYQAIVGGASAKNGFLASGGDMLELMEVIPQGGAGTLPAGAGASLSVDAFLSLLYPGGGAAPSRPVAAGPLDFFEYETRLPFFRLFYPPTPFASGTNGSTALEANVTLIGAMSWKTLASITDSYAQNGTFPTGIDYFATYFRGRASLTPLIAVNLQGESRWTALGVSVRQALTAQGLAPYYGGEGGQMLAMSRASANLYGYSTPGQGLALDDVDLGNAQLEGVAPLYWPLDMPLVGGDQVSLRQV